MNKNSYLSSSGFTIIEVLLVLGFSVLIAISLLRLIDGRVSDTTFRISITNFSDLIHQAMTDASSSYYNSSGTFTCNGATTPVQFNSSGTDEGQNYGCIFLGDILDFNTPGEPFEFISYPIAGNEFYGSDVIQSLANADPVAIAPRENPSGSGEIGGNINLGQTYRMEDQLSAVNITATDFNPPHTQYKVSAFGFLLGDSSGNLAQYSSGQLNSGSLPTSLYYVKNSYASPSETEPYLARTIAQPANLQPASSIQICLDAGTGDSVLVTITGTNDSDISSQYKNGDSC